MDTRTGGDKMVERGDQDETRGVDCVCARAARCGPAQFVCIFFSVLMVAAVDDRGQDRRRQQNGVVFMLHIRRSFVGYRG